MKRMINQDSPASAKDASYSLENAKPITPTKPTMAKAFFHLVLRPDRFK